MNKSIPKKYYERLSKQLLLIPMNTNVLCSKSIINVDSIDELMAVVCALNKNSKNILCYRGLSNHKYFLQSSLAIQDKTVREPDYIDEAIRLNKHLTTIPNYFDRVALLQHYGLPTRCIDFSTNFFIALYFACTNDSDKNSEGRILVTDVPYCKIESNRLIAEFYARLARGINDESSQVTYNLCKIRNLKQGENEYLNHNEMIVSKIDNSYAKSVALNIGVELQSILSSYYKPIITIPTYCTNREKAQSTIMLFTPNITLFETHQRVFQVSPYYKKQVTWDNIVFDTTPRYTTESFYNRFFFSIIISTKCKKECLRLLNEQGYSMQRLFPDKDTENEIINRGPIISAVEQLWTHN